MIQRNILLKTSLVLVLALLPLAFSGHITPWDLEADYINQGLAKTFKLYFTLDNPLPANSYARIVWPYDLGFNTSWSSVGAWGTVSGRCSDPDITFPAEIKKSQLAADSAIFAYYVRFTSGTAGTFGNLLASQPYLLTIKALSAPTTSGTLGPIEFYTVSSSGGSTETDYITYDANPIFSYIHITATPATTLSASFTSASATKNNIVAYNYPITIDITPLTGITDAFRLEFATTNTEFTFVEGTCINLASAADSITKLATGFKAVYKSSSVFISANEALPSGRKLRFQCGLRNPGYVTTGGMIFRTMWLDAPNVIETATQVGGLSTVAWNWGTIANPVANLKVYLGWGIDFTSTVDLPDCVRIYKNYETTKFIYNTVKFGFRPSASTPTAQEVILKLETLNSASFVIIPSTLVENLPDAKDKKAVCTINTGNIILCKGVGPLSGSLEYFISFKFYILKAATEANVGSTFGQIQITDTSNRMIVQAGVPVIADNTIYSNADIFYADSETVGDAKFRADNLVHTFRKVSAVTPSNTRYGMQIAQDTSTIMDIVFEHTWVNTYITTAALATGDGVEYFTTSAVVPLASKANEPANCQGETNVTFVVCEATVVGNIVTAPGRYYTRLRFGPNGTSPIASQFPATKSVTKLRMTNIKITKPSSFFFADDGIYDFYGRSIHSNMLVANLDTVNIGTGVTKFIMNSYTVTRSGLSNIQVGVSMYWTGSAAGSIDGTQFPAYIRILGYFTAEEKATVKRLGVFFNGLNFFTDDDGTVPCASNVKDLTCYGNTGHQVSIYNPLVLNRITVDISPLQQGDSNVNRLQIVIPVKTVAAFNKIDLTVAALTDKNYFYTAKNYFQTTFVKVIGRKDFSGTVLNPTSLTTNRDNTYRIILPSGARVGQTAAVSLNNSIAITKNADPDSSATPNIYAAMSYCAPWAWNVDESFAISPIPDLVTTVYRCISVSYKDAGGVKHWCSYCPIEDTLTTTGTLDQTSTNFILPYQQGGNIPASYMAFSTNNGMLYKYGEDTRASALQIPSTLSALSVVGNPSALYKTFNNFQISIIYVAKVVTPYNAVISIIPAGSSFGFTVISGALAFFDGTICTLSAFAQTGFTCTLSATQDLAVGTHNLTIKGVDMLSGGANSFDFNIQVLTSGGNIVEQNGVSSPGTYAITSNSTGYQLAVRNLAFSTNNVGANSWFSFEFRPQKVTTFINEQFVFNMGNDFKAAQTGRPIYCKVYEGDNIFYRFKSCIVSDLNTVTLQPITEYWRNDSINSGYLKLVLHNVLVPASISTTLSGTLQRSATTIQTLAAPIAFPAVSAGTTIAGARLTMVKKYAREGSILELQITYNPSVDITNAHSIYIIFPIYYSHKLGYKNVYCTIDNEPVYCLINRERTLQIRYFEHTYAANTAHVIKIFGIRDPFIATASNLFFALDNDEDITTFVEQGSITDSNPTLPTLQPLIIYNITISSTEFRTSANYLIDILTGSSAIASGNIIAIDFPDKYGNFLTVPQFQPTCSLKKRVDDGTTYASACTYFGSRIKVTLSTGLAANTRYNLALTGTRNPDQDLCKMNKLVISVVDSTEVQVLYRSISSYANSKFITYTTNSLLDTLQWSLANGKSLDGGVSVSVPRGMFSEKLCLSPKGDKFKESFNISLDSTDAVNFTINPTPTRIGTGHSSVCIQIGGFQTTPTTFYDLKFVKAETSPNNFTNVPRLRIHLLDKQIGNTLAQTSYDVPTNGVSLPIMFDFSSYMPTTKVTITATLSNTGPFKFLESDAIAITVADPIGYFFMQASGIAAVGDTGTLTFTLTDTNAPAYVLNTASVTLNIVNPPTTAFTYTVAFSNLKQTTYQEFLATANQASVVYWGNILDNTFDRPCDYIKDNALEFTRYNNLDYAQEQFGFVLLPATALSKKFNVTNLRSKQDYKIKFCGESLSRTQAASKTLTYSSIDNNVRIVSATFTLNATLTKQQEIDLACFFASEFRLLEYNVMSQNQHSCIENLPAVELPTVYTTPPTLYVPAARDTSTYSYTGRRLSKDDPDFLPPKRTFGFTPAPTAAEIFSPEFEGRFLSATTNPTITYIFYGNAETEEGDTIDSKIQARLTVLDSSSTTATDLTLGSQLKIFMDNYPGGFPLISNGVYNGLINTIAPNFASYPVVKVSKGIKWIALSSLKMESSGYVYGVVVRSGKATPNPIQIKYGLDGEDSAAVSVVMKKYSSDAVVLNFTGLANFTEYDIFYYGTNEDLSRFAITTDVNKLTITTSMAPSEEKFGALLKMSCWSLLVAALVAVVA